MDTIPQLSEIIISGKRSPLVQKKDTLVFSADAFKNGTEKRLEDLLRNIPGMKVDPFNGKLSYMGRTIQAVKLDGADLTGLDYVNLTRNISSDLIDAIEAIDNDPDNPLLKEIRPSGKLVLNLKLKKGKGRSSGEVAAGLGAFSDQHDLADLKANLLRLSKKIKSFMTAGMNNRGVQYGAFNYFDEPEVKVDGPDEYKPFPIIVSSLQSLLLPPQRYYRNQNYMMNGNYMFQPKDPHRSIRLNFYGMTDRLHTQYDQANIYRLETKIPSTSDEINTRINPIFSKFSIEWKQFLGPKVWMKYASVTDRNYHANLIRQLMNKKLVLNGCMAQQQFRYYHQVDFTYSISRFMAFRTVLNLGRYDLNEQMRWEGSLPIDSLRTDQIQIVKQKRIIADGRVFLYAQKNNHDYEMETGFTKIRTVFHAKYSGTDNVAINQIYQHYIQAYQSVTARFRWGGWMVRPKIKVAANDFGISYPTNERILIKPPLFEPEISVTKKLSDQLKWVNDFSISNRLLSERPFFEYPVWVSARELYVNSVIPELQNVIKMQSVILCQDLFRQLHGQVHLSYVRMNKVVASQLNIDARNTQTNFSVLDKPVERFVIQASAEKFIPKLRATFLLESHYSTSYYYNFINDKDIRKNTINLFESSIKISKNLPKNIKVVYDVKFIHNKVLSSSSSRQGFGQLSESFQVLWQKSKIGFARLITERYRPQLSSSYSIFFLDAEVLYKPVGHKFSFSVVGKNLLNYRYFKQVQISDYGSTEIMTRLLPGYVMIEYAYRF
ncbi:MAG: hypothetical protein ACK5BV_02575 [Bacteroidota bacterium]